MEQLAHALKNMIANKNLISEITKLGSEYYFTYNGKFVWSININRQGNYILYFYKSLKSAKDAAAKDSFVEDDYIAFLQPKLATLGALPFVKHLYDYLHSAEDGFDKVLDEIING